MSLGNETSSSLSNLIWEDFNVTSSESHDIFCEVPSSEYNSSKHSLTSDSHFFSSPSCHVYSDSGIGSTNSISSEVRMKSENVHRENEESTEGENDSIIDIYKSASTLYSKSTDKSMKECISNVRTTDEENNCEDNGDIETHDILQVDSRIKPELNETKFSTQKMDCHVKIININKNDVSTMNKVTKLLEVLSKSAFSVDLKLTLYMVACNNYPQKCFTPFPDHIVEKTVHGFNKLQFINVSIPSIDGVCKYLKKCYESKPEEINVINILFWLLVTLKEPLLVPLKKEEHTFVMNKVSFNCYNQYPLNIFKVMYSQFSKIGRKWLRMKIGGETRFGYYSTKLENVHSILFNGIENNFLQQGDYGKGIYLKSNILRALSDSVARETWEKSYLPKQLIIVAIVEFIDYSTLLSKAEEVTEEETPTTFYVPSKDFTILRYLMLYDPEKVYGLPLFPEISTLSQWLRKYRYEIVITACCLLTFISINFAKSNNLTNLL